jgi:hypothetical protein
MYKGASRFSQRAWRSDFSLERIKAAEKRAARRKSHRRKKGLKTHATQPNESYLRWIRGPVFRMLKRGLAADAIARELTSLGLRNPFGGNWSEENAKRLIDEVLNYLSGRKRI